MTSCDKCGKPFDSPDGFFLRNPILGEYRICDLCGLARERFIDTVDRAIEQRKKREAQTPA